MRSIALIAMIVVAIGAAFAVLVSYLGWEGVYENNEDQADAGLYFVASLVGFAAAIGAITGLWTGSRRLTVAAVLAQAAAVLFVLLLGVTSVQGVSDEDMSLVLALGGVLVVDGVAGIAVARGRTT